MFKWIRKVKQIFSKSPSITFENISDNIYISILIGDPAKNGGAGTILVSTSGGGGWGGSGGSSGWKNDTLSMNNGGVAGVAGGSQAGGGSCEVPPQKIDIEEHK